MISLMDKEFRVMEMEDIIKGLLFEEKKKEKIVTLNGETVNNIKVTSLMDLWKDMEF